MKKLIIFFKPVINILIVFFWYIFKPKMQGVKILLTHNNEVLFINHTYNYGWSFPGGAIDRGESKDSAIIREVREEIGII